MAIPGGSVSRISNGLQTITLLAQIRQNSLRMFQEQQRLATGQRLVSIADDPIDAEKIARFSKSMEGQEQILRNLRHADGQLAAADTAISDMGDLLIEAARVASEQASNLSSPEERGSQALVIDAIIRQLEVVGNRQFQGLYLFGGRDVFTPPFTDEYGRVSYTGDVGDRHTLADDYATLPFNVIAADLFRLGDPMSGGYAGFTVQLSADARISELRGATEAGVRLGMIDVTEAGLNISFQVDFTGAETVGDLIARFNDAAATAGTTLTLGMNSDCLEIVSGGGNAITVDESGNGTAAGDLGIRGTTTSPLIGTPLGRRATVTTAISDLGAGFSLTSGVVLTNGERTETVSFAGASSLGDVLNILNTTDVGIRASINERGDGIQIENLVAGTPLIIGENGGTDAAALGIRTTYAGTLLSDVSNGRGLHPVPGNDIRITDANGVSFELDVDGLQTVQNLIDAINSASTSAGSSIVAQVSPDGGGLQLTGAAGPGVITVDKVNLSPGADDLGLFGSGSATVLDGTSVFSYRQPGVLSALYRLRDALAADDTSEITEAGSDLNELQKHVANIQGQVGARSAGARSRLEQTEDAVTATTILLSEIKDADLTEAITKFQQAQTALQSTLLSASQTQNLSLLNFLR
jgi:flagellar hook-associated protein 3 FlgL